MSFQAAPRPTAMRKAKVECMRDGFWPTAEARPTSAHDPSAPLKRSEAASQSGPNRAVGEARAGRSRPALLRQNRLTQSSA